MTKFVEPPEIDLSEFEEKESFVEPEDIDLSEFESPEPYSEPEVSQLETLGRSAAQGVSLGFADEIGAGLLTLPEKARRKLFEYIPGTPEVTDKELREKGFTGAVDAQSIGDIYRELRDASREADKRSSTDDV